MARHLIHWAPAREFEAFRQEMDRLFDNSLDNRTVRSNRYLRLPLDAYVTDDELVITTALPGVDPNEVELTFEDEVLTIKGTLPEPKEDVDYVVRERLHGAFQRTVNIHVPVAADEIEATFDRGVLTITLPKAEEAKPKTIPVKAVAS